MLVPTNTEVYMNIINNEFSESDPRKAAIRLLHAYSGIGPSALFVRYQIKLRYLQEMFKSNVSVPIDTPESDHDVYQILTNDASSPSTSVFNLLDYEDLSSNELNKTFPGTPERLYGLDQGSLKLDRDACAKIDSIIDSCHRELRESKSRHFHKIVEIEENAERCLEEEYVVDELSCSTPRKRSILLTSETPIKELRTTESEKQLKSLWKSNY